MHARAESIALHSRVAAAARGDRSAYERLVHDHRRLVATISLAIVGEVAASEDVAQEVFVAAWRGLPQLRNPDSFLPWLRQMTRNRAHKLLEARKRRRELRTRDDSTDALIAATIDPRPRPDARLLGAEEEAVLREALDGLPDESREILTLFYREGQSVRQVAELLGLAEDAAKKRLSRARAKLREDVLERFGQAAERTAPGEELVRSVLAALPAGSGGAGGAVAWNLVSAAGKGATFLGGALLGAVSGLAGVFFGVRAALRGARDGEERRQLWRLGLAQALLCAVVASTYPFLTGWAALADGVAFVVVLDATALVWAPRIVARRMAAELAESSNAAAKHRRNALLRGVALTVGSGAALAALLYNYLQG